MAVYGSFNFRCLCEKQERSKVATFFNDSFKRVVLYETFFVMGEDNSINSINAPRFYELIRQKAAAGDRYFTGVNNSVQIWNEHIVKSQLANVQKVSSVLPLDYNVYPLHHIFFFNIPFLFFFLLKWYNVVKGIEKYV